MSDELALAANQLTAGEIDRAVASLERILAAEPDNVVALNLLGAARMQQRRFADAEALFASATTLEPQRAEYFSNLSSSRLMLGDFAAAEGAARQALSLDPRRADAHANLGTALRRQGRLEEAAECFGAAAVLRPDLASYRNNHADLLLMLGRLPPAIAELKAVVTAHPRNLKARSDLIMALNYDEAVDGPQLLEEARRYGDVARPATAVTRPRTVRKPDEKLRIGLLSGDLRQHSVAHFIEAPLRLLRQNGHEVFAYATRRGGDAVTARLRPMFSGWRELDGRSDSEAAAIIAADRVHILIDLSGHTGANRLSLIAREPAPVTASWIGYSGTSGVIGMDYIIADRRVLPPGDEGHFTELAVRLPDSYLLFQPPPYAPPVPPLPYADNGHVTFGSFNNLTKLSEGTIAAWARILAKVPGSRLVLKSPTLSEALGKRLIEARFTRHGVEPGRLDVLGSIADPGEHLLAYGLFDIGLDPFPYNGTTTTCEALWMGRPVLSLRGDRFTARVGDSLMSTVGLADWVADDVDGYVALAATRAADLGGLSRLSAGLRGQMRDSPLVDAPRFAEGLEVAFEQMWQDRQTAI